MNSSMNMLRCTLSVLLFLSGCEIEAMSTAMTVVGDPGRPPELTRLADSLDPLREHFNAGRDRHQFLAILSPT